VVPPGPAAFATPLAGGDDVERVIESLGAKAVPAALRLVVQQMVSARSESERRRCAEIVLEHMRGKAKQYERKEKQEAHVADDALVAKLQLIEARLRETTVAELRRLEDGSPDDPDFDEGAGI